VDTKLFFAGAIGALAPEIVRLYTLATDGKTFAWSPALYIPMSLLIAALGGFIAVILPTGNLQSAFYAGIGTPALIAAVARKARDGKPADTTEANKNVSGPSARSGTPQEPRASRVGGFFQAL
jgi:hypothetical protein